MALPASLKPVVPYVKRAEELDNDNSNPDSKTIAYFCRSYAMERALKFKNSSNQQEVNSCSLFFSYKKVLFR